MGDTLGDSGTASELDGCELSSDVPVGPGIDSGVVEAVEAMAD
jgi:hypothetical protein